MSKEDKKAQVLSKLFPVSIVKINGVPIEIRPLRHGKICEAIDFFYDLIAKATAGEVDRDVASESVETLNRYLNESITVPDDPTLQIEDLPASAIPAILEAWLEHTLKPGNWKALAQNLQEKFGLKLGQGQI